MRHTVFAGLVGAVLALTAFAVAPALAQTAEDPVAACRTAHANDLAARVACLELAVERLRAQPTQQQAEDRRPNWAIPGFRAREEAARAEDAVVRVSIVRVSYGRDGLGRFVTAEGQIWRETVAAPERRWLRAEEAPFEGEISRGPLGGFRLNIDGIRWEYRIEPVD